ncbi:MAG: DUF6089 family protein [Bacteroidota bacterium]
MFPLQRRRTCGMAGFLMLMWVVFSNPVSAQWVDLGFGGGLTSYRGDIQVPVSGFKPGAYGAIHAKYNFSPHWGVKLQVGQGQVSAADSVSGDPKQIQRNLSFTSSIVEARVGVEFNFWPYVPGSLKRRSAPYLGLGLGRFFFDPMARHKGTLVALQPLGTEGQGLGDKPGLENLGLEAERYTLNTWIFPISLGYRRNFKGNHGVGIEWTYCFTGTDFLDDISGTYFDASYLRLYRNTVAADMSDRSWEKGLSAREPGSQRGVNAYNDAYGSLMVYYHYHIPSRRCRIK